MRDWLDSVAGPGYAPALLWTFAALVLLVIVLVIIRLIRSMTFGTFVAGGRNRKTRLAVMDATAVDSHRRLVLIRRDDIEHLLLIGGPTDVVVERDIRLSAPRRPALTGDGGQQQPAPQRPRPSEPAPARQAPPRPQTATAAPQREPTPPPRPAPPKYPSVIAPQAGQGGGSTFHNRPAAYSPVRQDSIDDELLNELEVSLDDETPNTTKKAASPSLDDEMTKLLGELASNKR